jgi:hypothetical protein
MHVPMLEAVKVGRTKRDPWLRRQELTKLTGFRHVVFFAKWLPDATGWEAALKRALAPHRRFHEGGLGEYYVLGPRAEDAHHSGVS